ncbi:hypothetical protein KKF34_01285 [Myxococcota bacterium]|nr:hypothetical protein [Myxococcota bacterium]MBU1381952.1 hypothetical protein [Myxococcota bacterium]MBU1495494.1 hypothetical protein [Myxococcota bacterium]
MLQRGFDEAELTEGWQLFEKATGRSLGASSNPDVGATSDLISAIDNWENTWFDVADAALSRKHPEVHKELFTNLNKTSGIEVVANVNEFTNRLNSIAGKTSAPWTDAMALLAKRGLTNEKINEVTTLLDQAKGKNTPDDSWMINKAELEAAREEMWAWYQDWAKTARTIVPNKQLRIMMGISSPTRNEDTPETPENPEV